MRYAAVPPGTVGFSRHRLASIRLGERTVLRPFDIEAIFPEAVAGPPRRRQSGGSAQGLGVTLIADYTLRTRAWLPSGAIVALLGEFGVSPGAARTSISRLARRGVLEGSRQGQYSAYRLTEDAAIDLSNGGTAIATIGADPHSWNDVWTVVVFSMPERESTRRRALREHLRWNGYAPLYDGVWITGASTRSSSAPRRPTACPTSTISSMRPCSPSTAGRAARSSITGRRPAGSTAFASRR
ncbi:hypothetical protein [Nonomuraea sp. NPDC049695]|uniref:hypothetical protein n=1 Tax=Nonomuraea sp. NPDC049695 TaxID=3154734 RepID=UPI003416CE92